MPKVLTHSLYLLDDSNMRCYEGVHIVIVILAISMILVYTLGFPLYCFIVVRRSAPGGSRWCGSAAWWMGCSSPAMFSLSLSLSALSLCTVTLHCPSALSLSLSVDAHLRARGFARPHRMATSSLLYSSRSRACGSSCARAWLGDASTAAHIASRWRTYSCTALK
jgi:hypothetical protein